MGQEAEEVIEGSVDVVVVDPDAVEEGLVEDLAVGVAGLLVELVAVFEKVERTREGALLDVDGSRGVGQALLDAFQLRGDPRLLGLHEIERDGVGVVGLEQLGALVVEPLLLPGQAAAGAGGVFVMRLQVGGHGRLDTLALLVAESDALVLAGDEVLDDRDEYSAAFTVGDLLVPAQANEVRIDRAVAVLGHGHDEPVGAGTAEDTAAQVVRVVAVLLAVTSGCQDVLHLRPSRRVDQGVVAPTWVGNTPVGDDALVVRVGQDVVQLGKPHRLGRVLRAGHGSEATGVELGGEGFECPLPRGKGSKCPGDVWCPLGVGGHGAHGFAVVVGDGDVAVPDRCPARSAPGEGLLVHTLDDFGGQVARVELGDGTHDPVQQHAAGGLVDVLAGGDQGGSGLPQRQGDLDVVHAVTSQPVDLVDDDVGDVVLPHVSQHVFEGLPVSGTGGLTTVNKLGDDRSSEGLSLTSVGSTLRRDGVPLRSAILLGLLFGADPHVTDGSRRRRGWSCFVGHDALPAFMVIAVVFMAMVGLPSRGVPRSGDPELLPLPAWGCDRSGAAGVRLLWFGIDLTGQAGLVQPDFHGLLADTEVHGEVVGALQPTPPGRFEGLLGHERTAGEVVRSPFGEGCPRGIPGAAWSAARVQPVSVAVVDDVLELVQQGEALSLGAVGAVEADDPGVAVPVAGATDGESVVDDGDARQVSQGGDVKVVRAAEHLAQAGGLPFRDEQRLVGLAATRRDEAAQGRQD